MNFEIGTVSVILALLLSAFNLWDKIETRIKAAKAPTKQLENRIQNLEALTSREYEQRFAAYDAHFKRDLERITLIEEGNKVTQRALLALLKHSIDGNEVEELKKASKALTEFLIER